jgi:hypothetical protein
VPDAPQELRAFFASLDEVPSWWDPAQAGPGCRAFHTHSQMFIGAFVGAVLVEGFATLISKSFSISGGVMDQGVRRLKQNNRHLVEIFMPGGLERQGDGWKLSVRVRLVHAQLRRLIARSPEWEGEAWGTPLSAAHIGYAAASFSALLLQRAQLLGVKLQDGERASFMQVWRRSAQLMGVVPELLFEREADALRLVEVGRLCEPPPSLESCQLANALVHAAPVVAGVEGTRARRALVRKIHRVSRAMIGDEMADALRYPRLSTFGALALMRGANRLQQVLHRVLPGFGRSRLASQFALILDLSHFEGRGLDYRVPGHVHAEKDDRR